MTARARDDAGQVGGVEGAIFGVLVFVLGSLVIANAWAVIDSKFAAASAAREATRTFVESRRSTTAEAEADADAAADAALVGYGRSLDRRTIDPVQGELARCQRVTFVVRYAVPLVTVPLFGRYGSGFTVVGRHSEVVDPFRSGLSRSSTCPAGLQR